MIIKKKLGIITLAAAALLAPLALNASYYGEQAGSSSTFSIFAEGGVGFIPDSDFTFKSGNIYKNSDGTYYPLSGKLTTDKAMGFDAALGGSYKLSDLFEVVMGASVNQTAKLQGDEKSGSLVSDAPDFKVDAKGSALLASGDNPSTNKKAICRAGGGTNTTAITAAGLIECATEVNAPVYKDKDLFKQTTFAGLGGVKVNLPFTFSNMSPHIMVAGGVGYVTLSTADAAPTGHVLACTDKNCTSYAAVNTIGVDGFASGKPTAAEVGDPGYASTDVMSAASLLKIEEKYRNKAFFMIRAGAGIDYKINEQLSVGAAYRFSGALSSPELEGKDNADLKLEASNKMHSGVLSVSFAF